MNKKNKINKYILYIALSLSFFAGLYFSVNKKITVSIYSLKDIIYKPFKDISNNKNDIVGKNINYELVEENNELKNISKIDSSLSGFKIINATVIERNVSYWMNSITINKGKSSGIDIGMAVVVGEGLIGKISYITDDTSVVKLITSNDNDNKISVKIKQDETYIYKVLEYENDELVIKGIENESSIKIGDIILTSGLSDIYPSGITIGEVYKIENDKYNISKKAYIKSKVQFDNLRFISVLERES